MSTYQVVVYQHVRHTLEVEADSPEEVHAIVEGGDWDDTNNMVVADRILVYDEAEEHLLLDSNDGMLEEVESSLQQIPEVDIAVREWEKRLKGLVSLGAMDPDTPAVVILASHRQSCDGPSVHGPFTTAGIAQEYAAKKYTSGEFDPDGCTIDYKVARDG